MHSLTSVDFSRGRGEGIRMMLEYAGIHYTETAFTKDNWPTHKRTGTESGLYPFGQGKILVIRDMHTKKGLKNLVTLEHFLEKYCGDQANPISVLNA